MQKIAKWLYSNHEKAYVDIMQQLRRRIPLKKIHRNLLIQGFKKKRITDYTIFSNKTY